MRWERKPLDRARRLRLDSTDAERALWSKLRNRGLEGRKFRRQCPILDYVVDFACLEERLIVELDGGHHAMQTEADAVRTKRLEAQGFRVLRFWNNEVSENLEGVFTMIAAAVQSGTEPSA